MKVTSPLENKKNESLLCDKTAVELSTLIVQREISSVELITNCIERIEQVNPQVNAVVTRAFDNALLCAKEADSKGTEQPLNPLHGLPILVKDLSDTKGIRTTYGSRCFENHVPDKDSAIVAALKSAGAIVLGKTNTPEFGAGANTNNQVFGPTCNPFNEKLTSGGSSGGSAVAVACGMSPLATGSDLGGSLRIPASFCGIVGMRPSVGRVPSSTHVCGFSPLWTDGPMARTVGDVRLFLSAVSASQSSLKLDPFALPSGTPSISRQPSPVDLSKFNIGFSTDLGVAPVDTAIASLFEQHQKTLSGYFARGDDLQIDLSDAAQVFRVLRAESLYASYAPLAQTHADKLGENVLANLYEAKNFTLADTAKANATHTKLFRQFHTLFDQYDALIVPATAVSPFPVENNYPDSINGESLSNYYGWYAITWAVSLMACPVVTLPCGFDKNGLPFGIQVIGARHTDERLLDIAQAIESALSQSGLARAAPPLLSTR